MFAGGGAYSDSDEEGFDVSYDRKDRRFEMFGRSNSSALMSQPSQQSQASTSEGAVSQEKESAKQRGKGSKKKKQSTTTATTSVAAAAASSSSSRQDASKPSTRRRGRNRQNNKDANSLDELFTSASNPLVTVALDAANHASSRQPTKSPSPPLEGIDLTGLPSPSDIPVQQQMPVYSPPAVVAARAPRAVEVNSSSSDELQRSAAARRQQQKRQIQTQPSPAAPRAVPYRRVRSQQQTTSRGFQQRRHATFEFPENDDDFFSTDVTSITGRGKMGGRPGGGPRKSATASRAPAFGDGRRTTKPRLKEVSLSQKRKPTSSSSSSSSSSGIAHVAKRSKRGTAASPVPLSKMLSAEIVSTSLEDRIKDVREGYVQGEMPETLEDVNDMAAFIDAYEDEPLPRRAMPFRAAPPASGPFGMPPTLAVRQGFDVHGSPVRDRFARMPQMPSTQKARAHNRRKGGGRGQLSKWLETTVARAQADKNIFLHKLETGAVVQTSYLDVRVHAVNRSPGLWVTVCSVQKSEPADLCSEIKVIVLFSTTQYKTMVAGTTLRVHTPIHQWRATSNSLLVISSTSVTTAVPNADAVQDGRVAVSPRRSLLESVVLSSLSGGSEDGDRTFTPALSLSSLSSLQCGKETHSAFRTLLSHVRSDWMAEVAFVGRLIKISLHGQPVSPDPTALQGARPPLFPDHELFVPSLYVQDEEGFVARIVVPSRKVLWKFQSTCLRLGDVVAFKGLRHRSDMNHLRGDVPGQRSFLTAADVVAKNAEIGFALPVLWLTEDSAVNLENLEEETINEAATADTSTDTVFAGSDDENELHRSPRARHRMLARHSGLQESQSMRQLFVRLGLQDATENAEIKTTSVRANIVGQVVHIDRKASKLYVADCTASVGGSTEPAGEIPQGHNAEVTFAIDVPRCAELDYVTEFFTRRSFVFLRHVVVDVVAPYRGLRFRLDAFSDVCNLTYAPQQGNVHSVATSDTTQVLYKKDASGIRKEYSILSVTPLRLPPTHRIPDFSYPAFANVYRICDESTEIAATLRDNAVFAVNGTVSQIVPIAPLSSAHSCLYYLCKYCDTLLDRRKVNLSGALYCHECRAVRSQHKIMFRLAVLVSVPAVAAPASSSGRKSRRQGGQRAQPLDTLSVKLEHVHLQNLLVSEENWKQAAIDILKSQMKSMGPSSGGFSQNNSQDHNGTLTDFFAGVLVGKPFKFICRWMSGQDVPSDIVMADIKPSFRLEAL